MNTTLYGSHVNNITRHRVKKNVTVEFEFDASDIFIVNIPTKIENLIRMIKIEWRDGCTLSLNNEV